MTDSRNWLPLADPKITAERAPIAAAAFSSPSRAPSGTPSNTRSTGSSRAAREGAQGIPSMSS